MAVLAGVFAGALLAPALAQAGAPARSGRLVWSGLARGPLSPADADALEKRLLAELRTYEGFGLVDAAGHALDEKLLANEAAGVARLIEEGLDLLLALRYAQALKKLDHAISVFESQLIGLQDHELLHQALLFKADALRQSGQRQAAKTTLARLAALGPRMVPTEESHPPPFLALWRDAVAELGAPGVIQVSADAPGASIQLDGKPVGAAPATITGVKPGKHYLVARWPEAVVQQSLQLAAGQKVEVALARGGPAEWLRKALLEAVAERQGPELAGEAISKILRLSSADGVLVGAVRQGGLLVGYHGGDGAMVAVGAIALGGAGEPVAVRRMFAAMFLEARTGEIQVSASGQVGAGEGLALELYGKSRGPGAVTLSVPPPEMPAGETDAQRDTGGAPAAIEAPPAVSAAPAAAPAEVAREPGIEPGRGKTSVWGSWWLWTIVGVAVAGGVTTGVLLTRPAPDTTNVQVVLPPR